MSDGDISLRDHLDQKIDALERHLDQRMLDLERRLTDKIAASSDAAAAANEVAKQAVNKAEAAVDKRLEGLNELRGLVTDYQQTLLPRSEADARFKNIEEKIGRVEDTDIAQGGHAAGLTAGWTYLIAAVGLLGGIAGILIAVFQ